VLRLSQRNEQEGKQFAWRGNVQKIETTLYVKKRGNGSDNGSGRLASGVRTIPDNDGPKKAGGGARGVLSWRKKKKNEKKKEGKMNENEGGKRGESLLLGRGPGRNSGMWGKKKRQGQKMHAGRGWNLRTNGKFG